MPKTSVFRAPWVAIPLLMAVALGPSGLVAQEPPSTGISLTPALTRNDAGSIVPGIELDAFFDVLRHSPTQSFSRSYYLSGIAHGSVIREPGENPDRQLGTLSAGGSVSLRKLRRLDADEDLDSDTGPFVFDLGVIGLGVTAGFEASQDWDEQAAAAGAELRYTHDTVWWLPSALITATWVAPLQSSIRDRLDLGLEGHGRADAGLYWFIPLPFPGPLWAVAMEGRGFTSWGMENELETAGFREGLFGSVALVHRPRLAFGAIRLDEILIRASGGKLPTMADEREAVEVGLRFGLGPRPNR